MWFLYTNAQTLQVISELGCLLAISDISTFIFNF